MENFSPVLYLVLSKSNIIFVAAERNEQNNLKIIYKFKELINCIDNNRISDFNKFFNSIKKNVYHIEQKLNFTFKELTLIIDNLDSTNINLSGYKKLNGSQILRENITYIINSLKAYVDNTEKKKTIIHIFNSKYILDYKKLDNLPIGLFGDFYSHELSFSLINTSDYKNLKNAFANCNLKLKKILLKNFVIGAYISNEHKNLETFFQIRINKKDSQIFFFENASLKHEQNFKFGSEIILKDISKITSLKINTIKKILNKTQFNNLSSEELIEKDFFEETNYIKIKKKLIYEIILARIEEISEIIIFKNINFRYYDNKIKFLFLDINDEFDNECLKDTFKKIFSFNNRIKVTLSNNLSSENLIKTADRLVHFGWKKEAIPVTKSKKSLVARFFESLFG